MAMPETEYPEKSVAPIEKKKTRLPSPDPAPIQFLVVSEDPPSAWTENLPNDTSFVEVFIQYARAVAPIIEAVYSICPKLL